MGRAFLLGFLLQGVVDSCFCGRFVGLEGMGGSSGSICCGRVGLGGIVGMEGVSSAVVGEGRAI